MASNGAEFSGKTVEDAIEAGLQSLGLSRDEVDVDILNRGSRGILGFGSEPALVRVSPRQADAGVSVEETAEEKTGEENDMASTEEADTTSASTALAIDEETVTEAPAEEPSAEAEEVDSTPKSEESDEADEPSTEGVDDEELAKMATALLAELLNLMDFEADIDASWQDADETTGTPYLLLDIRGENLGALIGRRGETLSSIQYLLRLMINQQVKQWKNIVVDVEQYKQRRVDQLAQLAERMARQVSESGRPVTLEPMPGNERRIVHMTLRDNPDVFTESTGEGERRKVNIFPQR